MKKNNKVKMLKLIALILIIAILLIATIYMIPIIKQINTPEGQAQFKEKITNSGITGMLILFGLELAQVVLAILPGEPVELLAGICFGPIWGTIFLMVSVFIVTAMIYFFVKKYGRDFIYEFFPKEKVNKVENSKLFKDPQKVETVMALLFLIPGTPKDLLTYIGALFPIKPFKFILIATFCRFPSIISSTIVGQYFSRGNWKVSIIVYLITFVFTLLIIALVKFIDKEKITERALKELQ